MHTGNIGTHTLKAFDQTQAAAYIGATVLFDQENEENLNDQAAQFLGDVEGKVVDGIFSHGTFAVTVMFETDMFAGVLSASAERFVLKMDA